MGDSIAVHGLEKSDDKTCERALIVHRGGERVEVPVYHVRPAAFVEEPFDVPESVTFTRVYLSEERLEADAWMHDGSLVLLSETEPRSGQFRCQRIPVPSAGDRADEEIWQSSLKAEQELTKLVEQDLSAAEALDYWANERRGISLSNWADRRGVSQQAVSENRLKAVEKLQD